MKNQTPKKFLHIIQSYVCKWHWMNQILSAPEFDYITARATSRAIESRGTTRANEQSIFVF